MSHPLPSDVITAIPLLPLFHHLRVNDLLFGEVHLSCAQQIIHRHHTVVVIHLHQHTAEAGRVITVTRQYRRELQALHLQPWLVSTSRWRRCQQWC